MTRFADDEIKKNRGVPNPGEFPQRITLELTNRCNLNCTFCPRKHMEKTQGFLDTRLAELLVDEMAEHLPVIMVPFFRGETLLHEDWAKILAYAKKKGVGPIQFASNATLMDQNAAEAILDLGLDFISFSMDTIDPEIYNRTRRGADYEKVLSNILRLLELKERRGLRSPEVQISTVDTPLYRPGMDAFVAFWRPRVDRVRIYIEHSQNGRPGSISESLPQFDRRLPCHKVFTDMVIYWDGEVGLCNHDWISHTARRIGNVKDKGIAAVWKSDGYQNIRSSHMAGVLEHTRPCDFCGHWKMYYLSKGYLGKVHSSPKSECADRQPMMEN